MPSVSLVGLTESDPGHPSYGQIIKTILTSAFQLLSKTSGDINSITRRYPNASSIVLSAVCAFPSLLLEPLSIIAVPISWLTRVVLGWLGFEKRGTKSGSHASRHETENYGIRVPRDPLLARHQSQDPISHNPRDPLLARYQTYAATIDSGMLAEEQSHNDDDEDEDEEDEDDCTCVISPAIRIICFFWSWYILGRQFGWWSQ